MGEKLNGASRGRTIFLGLHLANPVLCVHGAAFFITVSSVSVGGGRSVEWVS